MTGPLGNSEFCFPSTSMFPSASPRGTLRVSGKQNSLFPLGPVIKCLIFNMAFANFLYYALYRNYFRLPKPQLTLTVNIVFYMSEKYTSIFSEIRG